MKRTLTVLVLILMVAIGGVVTIVASFAPAFSRLVGAGGPAPNPGTGQQLSLNLQESISQKATP